MPVTGAIGAGIAVAAAAAACFEAGYVLQALDARSGPHDTRRAAWTLAPLVRRPRWVAGLALAAAGALLQLVALRLAPLTVVQPALALGVIALVALGARVFREPVGPREVAASVLVGAGVAVLGVAGQDLSHGPAHPVAAAATLTALAAVLASALAVRGAAPVLLVAGAGAGDALAALAAQRVAHASATGRWPVAAAWLAAAAVAVAGSLSVEMRALRGWAATRVGPIVLVCQTVIPVLAAPAVAGDRWGGRTAVILAALAAVATGAAVLARSAGRVAFQP